MSKRRRTYLENRKEVQSLLDLLEEAMGTIEPKQNDDLVERIERKLNDYRNPEENVEDSGKLQNI